MERSDHPEGVSVVVPAFEAAATVSAQIDALLAQEWTGAWEVIVADNGSSDATRALVEAMASHDGRVRLIDASDRAGPSHARNVGAANARYSLLLFCDADDVVADGWLSAMAEALRSAPAATGPQEQELLNPPWLRNVYGASLATSPQYFAGSFPYGPSANLAVRHDLFDKLGGFDETLAVGEDLDLCMRLWHSGHELRFVPSAVVHYRNRADLGSLWRQALRYGAAGPLLVKRLRRLGHAVPRRAVGLRNWVWLLRSMLLLRTRAGRARWLAVSGNSLGRLIGSIRHRSLYC